MPWWLKLLITIVLYLLGYWSRPHVDGIAERWDRRREQRQHPLRNDEERLPKPTDTRRLFKPRP